MTETVESAEVTLDRIKPTLPSELLQFSLDRIDILDFPNKLDELWGQILEELSDPRWITLAHTSPATYDKGCRGPICRKSVRENARRKRDALDTYSESTYAHLDPILEFYYVIAKLRLNNYRRERFQVIRAG